MTSTTDAAGALAAALVQVAAGVAAHTASAGCLPSATALAVSVPGALAGVLVVTALCSGRPLLSLAAAQSTVHACLAVAACTGAAAPHVPEAASGGHAGPYALMAAAHVVALVLCRATADVVVRSADGAATTLARLVRPRLHAPLLRLPFLPAPLRVPCPAPRACRERHPAAPRRGPPAARLRPLPA